MYKKILSTSMKEKFGEFYFVYYIVLGVISLLADEILSSGILTVIILFTAIQISGMFLNAQLNCFNSGFYYFRAGRPKNIFATALSANIPWLVFLTLKIMMIRPHIIFFILFIWFYLTVLGIMWGSYINNEVLSYGLLLLIFFLCMQKTLIHELYFRYITPILIFRGEINLFNVFGLCLLTVLGIAAFFLLKKNVKIFLPLILLAGLCIVTIGEVRYESQLNKTNKIFVDREEYSFDYNAALREEDMVYAADLLNKAEKALNNHGFEFKTTNYNMEYSIYFPWEGSKEKVFIRNNDGICKINFYTDSLCKISDKELITRYIYSFVDSDTELQETAVGLLAEEVAARIVSNENSQQITKFLYDNLVEIYGECVSPKQCVIAECLRNDPTSFYAIYSTFGEVSQLSQIDIEKLETSEAYKELFRRVTE